MVLNWSVYLISYIVLIHDDQKTLLMMLQLTSCQELGKHSWSRDQDVDIVSWTIPKPCLEK